MARTEIEKAKFRLAVKRGSYRGSYDNDVSYRRGRDSMGRYVSRDESRAKDEMVSRPHDMMASADGPDKDALRRCIQQIDNG